MNQISQMGKLFIFIGGALLLIGVLISLMGKLRWFGHLPGDFLIERKNFSFYFPLTTCLLLSALLSFILWLSSQVKK